MNFKTYFQTDVVHCNNTKYEADAGDNPKIKEYPIASF